MARLARMSLVMSLLPQRAYRWNFSVMGLDFSLFQLALSFVSVYGVMPLFVNHLTTSSLALGFITTVRAIGSSLPPILVARYTEHLRRKKPFLLVMTTFERLPYLVMVILIPALAVMHPTILLWLFFLMIGIATWFGGVGLPAWLDILARMLPGNWRGRFFGYSSALGGLLGIGGAAVASVILAHVSWPGNFALCFACTSVFLAVSFACIAVGREPPLTNDELHEDRHNDIYWQRLPAIIRGDQNFAWYLVAMILISSAGMAASFYIIDAKDRLGLSDSTAGIYAAVLAAASMLGNIAWGNAGDHLGHKRMLEGGAFCTALAALVALVARQQGFGIAGYGLVFVLVGLASSGIQLAGLTFIVDFAPEAQRPTYVGLANLVNVPFSAGAPLLGGIIASWAGYGAVFALAMGLACAGTFVIWRMVVDPGLMNVT